MLKRTSIPEPEFAGCGLGTVVGHVHSSVGHPPVDCRKGAEVGEVVSKLGPAGPKFDITSTKVTMNSKLGAAHYLPY